MYPLSETQYCPCNKYNAQPVGNWSDCILPEGGRVEGLMGMKVQGDIKECGQGYRFQAMVCYDQDNRLVETTRCNSHGGLKKMRHIIPAPLLSLIKINLLPYLPLARQTYSRHWLSQRHCVEKSVYLYTGFFFLSFYKIIILH